MAGGANGTIGPSAVTSDDGDEGERLDVASAPDVYLPAECLAPLPLGHACDAVPASAEGSRLLPADAALRVSSDSLELSATSRQSPEVDMLWSLDAELPCPTLLDGVPEGGVASRFEVEATVGIWTFGGFRFSPQGEFDATIEVELLDDCVHLLLRDVQITDPDSLEEGPILPPMGVLLAEPEGT